MKRFDPTEFPLADDGRQHLSGEDVSDTNFNGASLEHAEATGAIFAGSDMRECALADAILDKADMEDADLAYTQGTRVSAKSASFFYAHMQHADWHRADLRKADMERTNAKFAKFDYADFRGACVCGADLRYADFTGADLRGITWDGCTSWRGAYVKDALMDEDLRAALDIDTLGYVTSDTAYQH